eukprot:1072616-Rhodomonas_salina.2
MHSLFWLAGSTIPPLSAGAGMQICVGAYTSQYCIKGMQIRVGAYQGRIGCTQARLACFVAAYTTAHAHTPAQYPSSVPPGAPLSTRYFVGDSGLPYLRSPPAMVPARRGRMTDRHSKQCALHLLFNGIVHR